MAVRSCPDFQGCIIIRHRKLVVSRYVINHADDLSAADICMHVRILGSELIGVSNTLHLPIFHVCPKASRIQKASGEHSYSTKEIARLIPYTTPNRLGQHNPYQNVPIHELHLEPHPHPLRRGSHHLRRPHALLQRLPRHPRIRATQTHRRLQGSASCYGPQLCAHHRVGSVHVRVLLCRQI